MAIHFKLKSFSFSFFPFLVWHRFFPSSFRLASSSSTSLTSLSTSSSSLLSRRWLGTTWRVFSKGSLSSFLLCFFVCSIALDLTHTEAKKGPAGGNNGNPENPMKPLEDFLKSFGREKPSFKKPEGPQNSLPPTDPNSVRGLMPYLVLGSAAWAFYMYSKSSRSREITWQEFKVDWCTQFERLLSGSSEMLTLFFFFFSEQRSGERRGRLPGGCQWVLCQSACEVWLVSGNAQGTWWWVCSVLFHHWICWHLWKEARGSPKGTMVKRKKKEEKIGKGIFCFLQ